MDGSDYPNISSEIDFIHHGSITISGASLTGTATIPTPVNTAAYEIMFEGQTSVAWASGEGSARLDLQNSTTMRATRASPGGSTTMIINFGVKSYL